MENMNYQGLNNLRKNKLKIFIELLLARSSPHKSVFLFTLHQKFLWLENSS